MFKHNFNDNHEDSSRSSNSNRSSRLEDSKLADGETLCSESEFDEEDCDTFRFYFSYDNINT